MDQLINAANEKHALIIQRLEEAEKKIKLAQASGVNPKVNVKKVNIDDEKTRLKQENVQLKAQIDELINNLNTLENKRRRFTGETISYLSFGQGVNNIQVNGNAFKNEQNVGNDQPKQEKAKQEKAKQGFSCLAFSCLAFSCFG